MPAIPYPEVGTKVGAWTIISPAPTRGNGREVLCRCACGAGAFVVARQLRRGHSTRCIRCAHVDLQRHPQVGLLTSLLWNQILTGAVARKLPVVVTQDEAWRVFQAQQGRCALTGMPLVIAQVASKRTDTTASLDRIDSGAGYVVGNVQWVHKDINRMKGNLTDLEFLHFCQMVSSHRSS